MDFAAAVRLPSDEEVTAFGETGCLLLREFVAPEAMAALLPEVDRCLTPGLGYRMGAGMMQTSRPFNDFVFRSGIGEAAGRLMQAKTVRLYVDNLFVKEPATDEPLNWHNDLPYYPFSGGRIISTWIAMADITPEMSPLQLIPGSHQWNRWFKPHIPSPGASVKARVESIDLEPCPNFSEWDEKYPGAINILKGSDMRAGDAFAFTALTVHHSGPNHHPTQRRIGYSLRFLAEDVVWDPRPNTLHELADGALTAGERVDRFFPLLWARDGQMPDLGDAFFKGDTVSAKLKTLNEAAGI